LLNDGDDSLTYSVAGHHPLPVLYVKGKAAPIEISKHSFPIGLVKEAEYVDDRIKLPRQFSLLLFSDGILEHFKSGTLEQKEARLAAAVTESEGDFNRLSTVLKLTKTLQAPDDIAVMSVSGT